MARRIVARTTIRPAATRSSAFAAATSSRVPQSTESSSRCSIAARAREGAPLEKAACVARLTSPEPGVYQRSRVGELLRCPWHGWEFDMRNGQSWFDPKRVKVRSYPVAVESGEELQKGPYVAEIFSVHVEDSYVIIET